MNTCDTCIFYGPYIYEGKSRSLMVCNHPKNGTEATVAEDYCGCVAYNDHHSGQLKPGPKFGCIHHQQPTIETNVTT